MTIRKYDTYHEFGMEPRMITLEIGYNLLPLATKHELCEKFLGALEYTRKQIDAEFGLPLDRFLVRDNYYLEPNEYSILINGVQTASFKGMNINQYLCYEQKKADLNGIMMTKDPVSNDDAIIINETLLEDAKSKGYACLDLITVIRVHMYIVIRRNLTKFLTHTMVETLLNEVINRNQTVKAVVFKKNKFTLTELKQVLILLLKKEVSIKNISEILEIIADNMSKSRNPRYLARKIRKKLSYNPPEVS